MPQATRTCEAVGASLRSLSEPIGANGALFGGKYDIKRKIELYKGSVSTVYKCVQASGSPVVVKTYHKAKMADKHFHKLEREVAAMRALGREVGRKGIVQLLDTYEDAHGIYLVMECCEGGDLFKRLMLHGGKMSEHWVCVEVIAPLLRVLERMHGLHIIHRDIKPENIFITADGEVKLGDFGLAIDCTLELPFCRSGTLDYMAPEVLLNPATHTQESPNISVPQLLAKNIRPYSSAVDVWAVGCLAYELVCGRPPFEVEDEKQTASLIIYSNKIHFEPSATAAWADFVMQALTKDPRQRPDASSLLSHPWVRANLERAGVQSSGASAVGQRSNNSSSHAAQTAAGSAAHADGRSLESEVSRSNPAARTNSTQQQTGVAVGGASVTSNSSSSACGSGGSAAAAADASVAGSGGGGRVSGGGSSTGGATQRTASTSAQNFRTAAAMLATRAGQPGCMTPPPAVNPSSTSAASPTVATAAMSGAMYGGAPASAPSHHRSQQASSPAPSSPGPSGGHFRAANLASSGALRSLLDAFKNAAVSGGANGGGGGGGCGSGATLRSPSGARPPSAGGNQVVAPSSSSSGAGTACVNSAASLLRTSFQFQMPSERDASGTPTALATSSGSSTAAASKLLRGSFQVQLPSERERERERERVLERESVSLGGLSTAAVVGSASRGPVAPREQTYPTSSDSLPRCGGAAQGGAAAVQQPADGYQGGGGNVLAVPPLQRTSPNGSAAAAAAAAAVAAAAAGGGFTSPSRMSRSSAATTGGLATGPPGSFSGTTLPSGFLRPVVSLSAAGGCGPLAPQSPQQQQPLPDGGSSGSLTLPATPGGGHMGKPPRPQSESPGKAMSRATAVAAHCGANSPLRRSIQPSPPRSQQPQNQNQAVASPPRPQRQASPGGQRPADWAAGGALSPSAATLHDLTRSWGAVVSISVGKYTTQAGANGNGNGVYVSHGSGSGSGFASPQRPPVGTGMGGKGLDSYGLPAPTPVASGLPPSEYCSPRPSGVLERVKYHLRGGGSAAAVAAAQAGGLGGGGVTGQTAHVLSSAPFAAVDVM